LGKGFSLFNQTEEGEFNALLGRYRNGLLKLKHGNVHTPVFMPVGTQATVKCLLPNQLEQIGVQILLGNTFHLYLRPGYEDIRHFGGLHAFMGWDHPILTDSGGFQVFSLSKLNKITDEGVAFKSPLDGSEHFFTPELTVEIQEALGSDIAMVFDECAPHDAPEEYIQRSLKRTFEWAKRFHKTHKRNDQMVFGIVQGGVSKAMRRESALQITSIPFDGYAIGGLSVGEAESVTIDILAETCEYLPKDKPRYLMGVGSPELLFAGVELGVDMFDCVLPTRSARHATLYTSTGKVHIKSAKHKRNMDPLDDTCDCYTCRHFSKGYLQHLYSRGEISGMVLGSLHNIRFLTSLMENIRASIRDNRFEEYRKEFFGRYQINEGVGTSSIPCSKE
jgi:queuine tRNA-ribosyltransferase